MIKAVIGARSVAQLDRDTPPEQAWSSRRRRLGSRSYYPHRRLRATIAFVKFPEGASEWRLGGEPAAVWIRRNRRALVDGAMEALDAVVGGDARLSSQLRWIVDYNIGSVIDLLEHPGTELSEASGSVLVASAANRASEGNPIESLLDSYVRGTAAIWTTMSAMLDEGVPDDLDKVTGAFFEYLREVLILVARGFQQEAISISADSRDARFAVYSALIEGSGPVHVAARSGLPLASHYLVLAIRFGQDPEQQDQTNPEIPRRRRLHELQRVLEEFATGDVLSLVRDPTGTALVPVAGDHDEKGMIARLAERLNEVVGEVRLGAVVTETGRIPAALGLAEEILELVTAVGRPPGVWQLDDVLIPYQLTRPGPARDVLIRRLGVLDDHPDWELTIRAYLAAGSDRNLTARGLNVHPNTVDYRLRRFADSTGLDAGNPALASAVQAAIWVRDVDRQSASSL